MQFVTRVKEFVREVLAEFRKVTWPSRQQLVNSTAGLGYRIVRAQRFLQTDKIFAVLVVIGVIGVTIDVALRLVRARVGRWAA